MLPKIQKFIRGNRNKDKIHGFWPRPGVLKKSENFSTFLFLIKIDVAG
jgi:hypothetical protein